MENYGDSCEITFDNSKKFYVQFSNNIHSKSEKTYNTAHCIITLLKN